MIAATVAGTLEGEDLFEVLQCSRAFLFLRRGVKGAAVEEGAEEVDGSGVAVVIGPAAGVAGHVDRQVGAAVVTAVGREHLDTAGVQTGHPDRVLVRVGTAVGEEDLVQAGGSVLADPMSGPRARLDGGRGRHGAQLCGLFLNSLDDVWVLMADICEHQLGTEVDVLVAVAVPHQRALRSGHDHRRDPRLGRPRVKDMGAVELVDLRSVESRHEQKG